MTPTPEVTARTGVWFVGARGSVATTAVVGAYAVAHGLAPTTALVTELPELQPDGLPALGGLVFGGHDVSSHSLPKRAEGSWPRAALCHPPWWTPPAPTSRAVDAEVRPGHVVGSATAAEAVERLARDIADFRDRHAPRPGGRRRRRQHRSLRCRTPTR